LRDAQLLTFAGENPILTVLIALIVLGSIGRCWR
jgi:hypothetical protein